MRFEKMAEVKRGERFQAQMSGDKYYFTGRPCKHGHIAKRRTDKGECMQCVKLNYKRGA